MKKVVIIGGDFAGLWAAISAVRLTKILGKENEVSITLINKDSYHGLRPRFYESNLENARVLLEKFLRPLDVNFLIDEVFGINYQYQKIKLRKNNNIFYDRLIIASGSKLIMPDIPGLKKYAFNVDTFISAEKLKKHFNLLSSHNIDGQYTIVVAGGGFTGIEVATDLMDRLIKITPKNKTPRVIVIDRSEVASCFSTETQEVIFNAMALP